MRNRIRVLSRRDLLELAAACGALSFLPGSARADEKAEPAMVPVGDDAEMIGAILWSAFAKGAKIDSIPRDVQKAGHDRSEEPIREHLKAGLENFPLDRTVKCAKACGVEARRLAGNAGPITDKEFIPAWDHIKRQQWQTFERLKKKDPKAAEKMLGGAC